MSKRGLLYGTNTSFSIEPAQFWVTDGTVAGTTSLGSLPGLSSVIRGSAALDNGKSIFVGGNSTTGNELWVTDSTAAGTSLLKDINPGIGNSTPTNFLTLGSGRALFQATDGTSGAELWATDGTAAGTSLVKDINPGSAGSSPGAPVLLGSGRALFTANTASNGWELWVTDGTASGTSLVRDIAAGTASSYPGDIVALSNGKAVFQASNGSATALWVTDGTSAGTSPVITGAVSGLTALGDGRALFSQYGSSGSSYGTSVWITDGTAAGTSALKEVLPSQYGSVGNVTVLTSGHAVFQVGGSITNSTPEIWMTDGTSAGTLLLKQFTGVNNYISNLTVTWNGRAVFSVDDGINGMELWVTDGTVPGTSLLRDLYTGNSSFSPYSPNSSNPSNFLTLGNGQVAFTAYTSSGSQLWVTDGTSAGTSVLSTGGAGPTAIAVLNSVFAPTITGFAPDTGRSASDHLTNTGAITVRGTSNEVGGTVTVLDGAAQVATGTVASDGTWSATVGTALAEGAHALTARVTDGGGMQSSVSAAYAVTVDTAAPVRPTISGVSAPRALTVYQNSSYNSTAFEPYVTDGTAAGTSLLKDIYPGSSSSYAASFIALGNGRVLFSANDGSAGFEPWVTDGTTAGTSLVRDILPGSSGSLSGSSNAFTALGNGRILFNANDSSTGWELWVSDGTAAGTSLLKDVNPSGNGAVGGSYRSAVSLGNGRAVFGAYDGTTAGQLWVTDGTASGTSLVRNTAPSTTYYSTTVSTVTGLTATGDGRAVFSAGGYDTGAELWVTDGSAAGTSLVRDIAAGTTSSYPSNFAALGNGRVIFNANTGSSTTEVWVTDGTASGTSLLQTLTTATYNGYPSYVPSYTYTVLGNGRALFSAASASTGVELWVTDGAATGTSLLRDIVAGSGSSNPTLFSLIGNGRARFTVSAGSAGTQTWVSDGTAAGTSMLTSAEAAALPPTYSDSATFAVAGASGATFRTGSLLVAGTAEAGSQVAVFDGTAQVGVGYADSTGTFNVALTTALTEGAHSLTVRATDAVGNVSIASATAGAIIDLTAPAAPAITGFSPDIGSSATDGVTNTGAVTVSGTAEAGVTVTLYDGGTALGTVVASGAGAWSIVPTTPLSPGRHSLTARAADAAGNLSASSAARSVSVLQPPGAPFVIGIQLGAGTIYTPRNVVTNTGAVTVLGTAEAGSTVSLYDGASLLGTTTASGMGAWSVALATALGEGVHSLTAQASNAGGTSSPSAAAMVTVDLTAPATPTIASITPDTGVSATDGRTSSGSLLVQGAAEAGSTVTLLDNYSAVLGTTAARSDGTYGIQLSTSLAEGGHGLAVRATDAAGNASTSANRTVVVDTVAPLAPTNLVLGTDTGRSASDGVTSYRYPNLSGIAEYGATVSVYDGTVLLGTTTTQGLPTQGGTAPFSFFKEERLTDGQHTLSVRATDAAGNQGPAAVLSVVVDTTAPTAPLITGVASASRSVSSGGSSSTGALTVTGTAEAGNTVTLLDGTTQVATATVDGTGAFALTPAAALSNGAHSLTVQAVDLAGNASTSSAAYVVTVRNGAVPHDVNGSGTGDVVWQNANGAPSVWTLQGGSGGASVASYINYQNPGASWRLVGTGDLNGDGRDDLVWQNSDGLPSGWLVGAGGAGVQGYPVFSNPGQDWRLIGTGDLNGDGRDDLVWQNRNGLPSGWIMGPDGTSVVGYPVFQNPGADWRLVGAADLNGDGRDDLLWQKSDGTPSAWLMNADGTGVQGYPVFQNPGAAWRLVGGADLNGDGRDDLLWQNKDGTPSGWLMNANGTGVAGYPVFFNPGADWTLKGAADANGDGRADLLWQNANGLPSLWIMGAGGTSVESFPVLANPGADWRVV